MRMTIIANYNFKRQGIQIEIIVAPSDRAITLIFPSNQKKKQENYLSP